MKLISCNIEKNKHLDRVTALVAQEKPEAICLQEVLEPDVYRLEEQFGMSGFFAPMCIHAATGSVQGVAIFAINLHHPQQTHFAGKELVSATVEPMDRFEFAYRTIQFKLAQVTVVCNGVDYTLITTHMPVTYSGKYTEYQAEAVGRLLDSLQKRSQFILAGDLNTPRGGEAFARLSDRYQDNIPPVYQTSIDGDLHRNGPIALMVDGLFTTSGYRAAQVRLVSGVSDHCAIVAEVYRA